MPSLETFRFDFVHCPNLNFCEQKIQNSLTVEAELTIVQKTEMHSKMDCVEKFNHLSIFATLIIIQPQVQRSRRFKVNFFIRDERSNRVYCSRVKIIALSCQAFNTKQAIIFRICNSSHSIK